MAEISEEQAAEMVANAVKEVTSKLNGEAAGHRVAAKEAQEKLDAFIASQEAEKNKQAEEQGKYQELYTSTSTQLEQLQAEREALLGNLQNYEARDQKELETLLADVPDEYKGLIDGVPLAKQLEMARTFAKTKPKPPEFRDTSTPQPNTLTNSVDRIKAGLEKGQLKG